MKTNKLFSERIKVTRNGKMKRRKTGQNHFNARQSSEERMQKRGMASVSFTNRIKRRFLPSAFK